jgi:putative transposase
MARRVKAIRVTLSMKIALSEPLLVFVNNYVKAHRFTLLWLKEKCPEPRREGNAIESQRRVVHMAKGRV